MGMEYGVHMEDLNYHERLSTIVRGNLCGCAQKNSSSPLCSSPLVNWATALLCRLDGAHDPPERSCKSENGREENEF